VACGEGFGGALIAGAVFSGRVGFVAGLTLGVGAGVLRTGGVTGAGEG
jgi:hypothetical protein